MVVSRARRAFVVCALVILPAAGCSPTHDVANPQTCAPTSVNDALPTLVNTTSAPGNDQNPSIPQTDRATGLTFCAIHVNRVEQRYNYSGLVLKSATGTGPPPGSQLVVVLNVDPSTCFDDEEPALKPEQGGYFFLSRVDIGSAWSYHNPSPNDRSNLTIGRAIGYYFGTEDVIDHIYKQADENQGNDKNSGFVFSKSHLDGPIAQISVSPLRDGCR